MEMLINDNEPEVAYQMTMSSAGVHTLAITVTFYDNHLGNVNYATPNYIHVDDYTISHLIG